jgi:hypothetical protein
MMQHDLDVADALRQFEQEQRGKKTTILSQAEADRTRKAFIDFFVANKRATYKSVIDEYNRRNPQLPVKESTAFHWIAEYKADAKTNGKTRGARTLLTADEETFVKDCINAKRNAYASVDTATVRAFAMIAVKMKRPGDYRLARIAGREILQFTGPAMRSLMKRLNFQRRAKTGDRTVAPRDVVKGGTEFYATLRSLRDVTDPRLVFNSATVT